MKFVEEVRSDQSKEEIVAYEYDMFLLAYDKMVENKKDDILRSLFLESFLLHARNLIDFLGGNDKDDNLTIKDFLDRDSNCQKAINMNFDSEFIKKIHKHCHHISKTRLKHKYGWYSNNIKNELVRAMNEARILDKILVTAN